MNLHRERNQHEMSMSKSGSGKSPLLQSKLYLYLTEFFAGMAVMAVELGASRLLAPYFSSSQIVWTIIIGTIMIAMALGNVWGGRQADKDPDPGRLYKRLIIAAVWIACIPVFGKYLIVGISGLLVIAVNVNFLIWAAFLSCLALFVYPLFLLGTTTPSLVKYTVDSLDDNGKIVGSLGAANTIGSIIGTFVPTFVTIPAVGTAVTFLIFSGILLALGVIYWLSIRKNRLMVIIAFIAFAACAVFGSSDHFAFWENNLAYEGESIYNYLQVKDNSTETIFSTNVLFGVQSIRMKDNRLTGMYYDDALAAPVMAGSIKKDHPKILILGNGTGTFAGQCVRYFPEASVEGVEIDKDITELGYRYFNLSRDIPVTTYDGRAYLSASKEKYDVIMVDAYQDITIPFQMSSAEFFTLVRDHLTDDGVMVVNMNMRGSRNGSISACLSDTIASVFDEVETVNVAGSTNRELFAAKEGNLKSKLDEGLSDIADDELLEEMTLVSDRLTAYEPGGGQILTDDKAPVELLGMRQIDSLIQEELGYYKKIYRSNGISGLIDEIE